MLAIVATPGLALDQGDEAAAVPEPVKETVEPTQRLVVPVIVSCCGSVMVSVDEDVTLSASVTVTVYAPALTLVKLAVVATTVLLTSVQLNV